MRPISHQPPSLQVNITNAGIVSAHKLTRCPAVSDAQEAVPIAHHIPQAGIARLKRTHSDCEDPALREVQRPCHTKKAKTAAHARPDSCDPGLGEVIWDTTQVCGLSSGKPEESINIVTDSTHSSAMSALPPPQVLYLRQ